MTEFAEASRFTRERLASPRGEARAGRGYRGLGYPLINALGHTLRWRVEGLQHFDAVVASGRQPIMAFWHGRILPATFYFRRRGIVVITSENFDGEWIARIIERFGYGTARGSSSRGGLQGDAAAGARHGAGQAGRRSRSTARAVRRASRSRARSGWRGRPAIRCCRFTWRRRRTGRRRAGTGRRFRSRSPRWRSRSASRSTCLATPTTQQLESARQELEERLADARRSRSRRWYGNVPTTPNESHNLHIRSVRRSSDPARPSRAPRARGGHAGGRVRIPAARR